MLEPVKRKRAKIGDVIEVSTTAGLAYAMYTHKNANYGDVLRVFEKIHDERPNSLDEIIHGPPRFSVMFPLCEAVARSIYPVMGNPGIPDKLKEFPIFRCGALSPETNRVNVWWLWDGEKEWKIDTLTQEQLKLPIRLVWNDTVLELSIADDWRPETDPVWQ